MNNNVTTVQFELPELIRAGHIAIAELLVKRGASVASDAEFPVSTAEIIIRLVHAKSFEHPTQRC